MIGNAQRPIFYHGFGFIILDLETFAKVSLTFIIWNKFIKKGDLKTKFEGFSKLS